MADIKTYEEMDKQIKGILRMNKESPACLYAAQRIEELEQERKNAINYGIRLRDELARDRKENKRLRKIYDEFIQIKEI